MIFFYFNEDKRIFAINKKYESRIKREFKKKIHCDIIKNYSQKYVYYCVLMNCVARTKKYF